MGNGINDINENSFGVVYNFLDHWASMFGIDIFSRLAGKKRGDWDDATLTRVINEVFINAQKSTDAKIAKFTTALEGLIGQISSPTIKNIINKWRKRLNEKLQGARNESAEVEKDKAQMQTLASDIANSDSFSFMAGNQNQKKEEFRKGIAKQIADDPEALKRVQKIEGWEKFDPEKHKVEEPL